MKRAKMILAAPLLLLTSVGCDSTRRAGQPVRQAESAPSSPAARGAAPEAADAGGIRVGAKLYTAQGELWGTVVESEEFHRFPNGDVEPGVRVDYGPRMGDPPVPPQWLPRRSAARFTVR